VAAQIRKVISVVWPGSGLLANIATLKLAFHLPPCRRGVTFAGLYASDVP